MKLGTTLPIPTFFKPENAAQWGYQPDMAELLKAAPEWQSRYGITPSASDRFRLNVLGIDVQDDFCLPQGSLYVAGRSGDGAIKDSARLAEFIYRNLGAISELAFTFDTHFAQQIFFANFWVDGQGKPLSMHSMIRVSADGKRLENITPAGDVIHDNVLPNPAVTWIANGNYPWLCQYVLHYCKQLASGGRYMLYLWPHHCLIGSQGHALVGVIQEARLFHSLNRGTQSHSEVKGGHPLTENYSVFKPEVTVTHDGQSIGQRNTRFLEMLMKADAVAIGGQAASHCVKSSIEDLLDEIKSQNPDLAKKVYILEDCMSAVVVPGADFTPQAENALQLFKDAGMHVVNSTDPIESWPGLKRAA